MPPQDNFVSGWIGFMFGVLVAAFVATGGNLCPWKSPPPPEPASMCVVVHACEHCVILRKNCGSLRWMTPEEFRSKWDTKNNKGWAFTD